jgi:hypothetical protein
MLIETYRASGIGPTLFGRNGGGDRYYTDGQITIGVLSENAELPPAAPVARPEPAVLSGATRLWNAVKWLMRRTGAA